MKILFTGGGSGGHFYPIMAVAEALQDIARNERLLEPKLYFAAPQPYSEHDLFEKDITYVPVSAGKVRHYFSPLNILDFFKTVVGIIQAFWKLLFIYPDIVFGKGGYGSFPMLVAARLLNIPVIVHESDTIPSRVNTWAGKFAKRIAISFPEVAQHFEGKPVALTGNPIRKELASVVVEGGKEYLKISSGARVVLVLGGSQGAEAINEVVLEALPELVENYYVIHQTGEANLSSVEKTAEVILHGNEHRERYKPYGYLNLLALRMAAGAADIVVSRAGAGALFEIAAWGKPSIIVPIPDEVAKDQRTNAFAYARSGAGAAIEQQNLTPHLLVSEITRLMEDQKARATMAEKARAFARPDAAEKIAREIIAIGLEHEN